MPKKSTNCLISDIFATQPEMLNAALEYCRKETYHSFSFDVGATAAFYALIVDLAFSKSIAKEQQRFDGNVTRALSSHHVTKALC